MPGLTLTEFIIPLDKDELLVSRSDGYFVDEIILPAAVPQALDATRPDFQDDGSKFILKHFDTFFSVFVHGNKVNFATTLRAFNRLLKGVHQLINEMEGLFSSGGDIGINEKPSYLCMNKMYAYLVSSLACYMEDYIYKNYNADINVGKKKKSTQKSSAEIDWEAAREKALQCIYQWFQLPLQKLWTPPIVEDAFINLLTQFCYKVLEQSRDPSQKHVRETIFEILGTLVKRYNHGITCVVRIIQLVKLYDALAGPLAAGVVHMVEETGCLGFIKEMIREIAESEPEETDARNISIFLEAVATAKPNFFLPHLDDIMEHLSNDSYAMRNCVLGILGAVIQGALTGDELKDEQRLIRDECLTNLEEHILDINAYVRSKVLQIWQRLVCEGAVPLQRQTSLLKAASLRLEDKSAIVRKQTLHLLRALLQSNPFAAKLDQESFSKQLEEARRKLKEFKISIGIDSERGDENRLELWTSFLPEIRQAITEVLGDQSEGDESEGEDSRPTETEVDETEAFEKVRKLLLAEKFSEAVRSFKKICRVLPGAPDISDIADSQEREECFLLFLFKIFVESKGSSVEKVQDGDSSKLPNDESSQASSATSNEDLKRRKDELKTQQRLVDYLTSCLNFAKELEDVIPVVENLLFSTTASDAVESCTFLGTASQFGVRNALAGIRKALFQVFSRDQSVKNNVASVYKEIYLAKKSANQSSRQKALASVQGLVDLLQGLKAGQSPALCQLVGAWRANEELGSQELQVMWEKFSQRIPGTTPHESRAALVLLTMAANTEPSLITANLDLLIKVGLEFPVKQDLLLARDTCRALLKIKHDSDDIEKGPNKFVNDHRMFEIIHDMVVNHFTSTKDDGYVSFLTDAINVIYHLANEPEALMKKILLKISSPFVRESQNHASETIQSQPSQATPPANYHSLSRLFYFIGHLAIREMVNLDNGVYKELKRRNAIKDKKKNKNSKDMNRKSIAPGASTPALNASRRRDVSTPASARQKSRNKELHNATSEDSVEERLEGVTADDADADFITDALEKDILYGSGILANFVPLVLDVCRHPEKYDDEQLQAWGVLALSKMMTVSSTFCIDSLQLLVTIMERSPYPGIRSNILVALFDLIIRFPNRVEPWTSHIYGRLRDDNVKVRSTALRVLSNLIMREMIRVKGQVSGLALSIIDTDQQIGKDARQFFKDLSQKGNALYNVMPDILSRLMDPELNLEENDFKDILKFILSLVQKERQIDTLIAKLCSRFKLARSERQWRDISYCLSLLQFNSKSVRHLIASLPFLKYKIHQPQVMKSLRTVIEQTKRKAETKAACLELEEKLEEILNSTEANEGMIDDAVAMPPPPVPKQRKQSRRNRPQKDSSSEDEEDDDDDDDGHEDDPENAHVNTGIKHGASKTSSRANRNLLRDRNTNSDSDEGEEEFKIKRKASARTPKTPAKTPKTPAKTKAVAVRKSTSSGSVKRKEPASPATRTPTKPQFKKNKRSDKAVVEQSSPPTRRTRSRSKSSAL